MNDNPDRPDPAVEKTSDGDRLIELSKLAGGLAHEIRNPLSTININLLLLDEAIDEAVSDRVSQRRCKDRIATLRKEAKRLSDVLDDFMRYARMSQPNWEEADINEIVDEVVRFIAPEARTNGVTIRSSYGQLPRSCADRDLLKQALFNVIINAQQAMPDGGEIIVRTWTYDGCAHIHIADTGHGSPPDVMARIFDPYYSTKKGGSGLGLSLVKRIVEIMGGRIAVHSEINKGTGFTIILPLLKEEDLRKKPNGD